MRGADRPIAVITGASSGIGASFAEQLGARGCDLLITGRREQILRTRARELKGRFGVGVQVLVGELTDPAVRAGLSDTVRNLPRIDWLVNNAGYGRGVAFTDDEYEEQRSLLSVHVEAIMELTHAAVARMPAGGRIITVSSLAGYGVSRRSAVYCASKAFATSFTESLALELAPRGIGVLALLPGFTCSDFHRYEAVPKRNRGIVRWMPAETVVRAALRASDRGRIVCIPGGANRLLYLLLKLLPRTTVYRLMSGGVRKMLAGDTGHSSSDSTRPHPRS